MKKIPTLFKRDPADRAHVLPEVTPGCEWVLAGEGRATRKYDGTCVEFDGLLWRARREVKPGKTPPATFVEVEHDPTTGKRVGWEEAEHSPFARWLIEAVTAGPDERLDWLSGTYELIGPKVNGNPEKVNRHRLVRHDDAPGVGVSLIHVGASVEANYARLQAQMAWLGRQGHEGIVWHHPDGRMAKLKVRDYA